MPSGDPLVQELIRLHNKLEELALQGASSVNGWRPLRLDSKGWVIAGKHIDSTYRISEFHPVGKWKKAAEYVEAENELRKMLFSDLTAEQIDAYRAGIGLPPVKMRPPRRKRQS